MILLPALEIFLTWAVLAVALIGIGSIVLALFNKDNSLVDAFWMGLAGSVAILEIWSLLLPIASSATLLLLCIGVLGLLANRSILFSHVKITLQGSRWLLLLGIAFAFLLAVRSCGPCEYYDTGLYGASAVRWIQTYPAVPGLASLHGRLGFNSSVFLYIATLGQGVWKDLGFHLFTGFLLSALWVTLLPACARCFSRADVSPADWFHCILVLPVFFWTTRSRIVGTQTDEPAAIVSLIAAGILFEDLSRPRGEDHQPPRTSRLVLAATLFSLAVSFKLSTAVFALLAWCLVFRRIWQSSTPPQKRRFDLAATVLFSVLLLLPWCARGIILSGYPLFPATIFAFPVSWKTPLFVAAHEALRAQSWGRAPDAAIAETRGLHWLGDWFQHTFRNRASFQIPLLICLVGLAIALALRFRAEPKPRPECPWLALLFPSFASILFWFVAAPDLRFAQFAIWTAAATLGTWGIVSLEFHRARSHSRLVLAALLLCLTWCLISFGWREPIHSLRRVQQSPPLPKAGLVVRHTLSGLAVYVPAQGNQCWDAPLPCTPYFDETLRLRDESSLRWGFLAEGRSVELQKF